MPTTDDALRIAWSPAPPSSATAWAQWKTPRRLTSITRSKNCFQRHLCRRASRVMPALLTSTSMRPKSAFTLATTRSVAARSGDVEHVACGRRTERLALLHRVVHTGLLDVADDYDGTLTGKLECSGESDALCGAGDEEILPSRRWAGFMMAQTGVRPSV